MPVYSIANIRQRKYSSTDAFVAGMQKAIDSVINLGGVKC